VTVANLKVANGLASNLIYSGQVLVIPSGTSVTVEGDTGGSSEGVVIVQPSPRFQGFAIIRWTPIVSVGGNASVTIETSPGVTCTLDYVTPHGTVSIAQGLGTKMADANGECSWIWKIGTNTLPGIGTLTITANGVTQSFDIVVQ
jgi:LysM repeat protein